MKAAIYARVSTVDQDLERQLHEGHEHLEGNHSDIDEINDYANIVSGVDETRSDEYHRIWDEIIAGEYDLVVHEINRISRLGPAKIYEFLQHCLENETAIKSLTGDLGASFGGLLAWTERGEYPLHLSRSSIDGEKTSSCLYSASSHPVELPLF